MKYEMIVPLFAALLAGCTQAATGPKRAGSLPPAPADLITPPAADISDRGATDGSECVNAGLEQFKGRPATSETGAEMLRVSRARIIRWARPGMMMTMEFSPERLTVHIDSANRVDRATCG